MAGLFLLFPLAGLLSPELWWGSHFLNFLPTYWIVICFGLAVGLIGLSFLPKFQLTIPRIKNKWVYRGFAILIALLAAILFHSFPMANDPYGDAFLYFPLLEIEAETLDPDIFGRLFTMDLEPGQGRRALLRVMTIVSHWTHLTYREAYLWLGTITGFAYVLSWLLFVRSWFQSTGLRFLGAVIALGTPMIQVYFGHIESYGLVVLILSWWAMALFHFLKNPNVRAGWVLLFLWLIGFRFHSFFLLLLPVLLLAYLNPLLHRESKLNKILTFKGMLSMVYLPLTILGLLAYFFVFKDHTDPRSLDDIKNIQRLFLPLVPPEAPLDRYNLLSGWHLFDYLNMVLFWSLPAWTFILATVLGARRTINWNRPELVLSLLGLLLMASMLFMMNPLFSMPFDWDLFCIAVPLLVAFVFSLGRQLEHPVSLDASGEVAQTTTIQTIEAQTTTTQTSKNNSSQTSWIRKAILPTLALSLFTLPVISVNADESAQSQRIEFAGKHVFKSYHLHSTRFLLFSLNFPQVAPQVHLAREEKIVAELEPYAYSGNDGQYLELLVNCANMAYNLNHDPKKGAKYYLMAEKYGAMRAGDVYNLMYAHLDMKEYPQAQARAQLLLSVNYPNREQALLHTIWTSLEAGDYPTASQSAGIYLKENPKAAKMGEVIRRIEENDRVGELVEMFRKK